MTVCKHLVFTHGHDIEEQLWMARMIKAFHKKKEWLNSKVLMENEERKAMAEKFDKDLRLHFQEEVEKQKLKAAQELHKKEERKLEEAVKQLSAEHGVSEEDIQIQMQLVQDIVKAEVKKKIESERKEEEEKKRTEEMVHERERKEEEEKKRTEEMVCQREQQEWEQNWYEQEQSALKQIYDREREMEMEMGVEEADMMAWEEEEERHFEVKMSKICREYEQWHETIVKEAAENRRIDEVEYDRTQIEYEIDRKWMAEELVALDLEEKLKWLQDETEQMEEIGEWWDRLGPYTEGNFEILQVANTVEEEEKEKDLPGSSMPARGRRKRRRGG